MEKFHRRWVYLMHANAGLASTRMVSQATGVVPPHNVVDLTEKDDDNDDEVRVEDVPDDKDDDNDPHKNDENQTQEPVLWENQGRGIRIRTQQELYKPLMSGKLYKIGINNLCYRGKRYS